MRNYLSATFGGRRLVHLCGLAPAIVTAVVALYRPAFLSSTIDSRMYDRIVHWAGTRAPGGQVVVVDVDERSLSAIGQWPWRRHLVGRLVNRIRDLGASSIALDIVFAEPDRYDRPEDTTSIRSSQSADAAFADALQPGRVVLGYAFTFDRYPQGSNPCVLHPLGLALVHRSGERTDAPLFRATGAVCSLPVLARAAGASGFMNAAPDADGILRRVPLLLEFDGRVYPGLALAAVTAATKTHDAMLRVVNANTASLILDDRIVPLDGKSNLLVRYRGKKRSLRHVSAVDVLAGQIPAGTFEDKVVFVGGTALGTREVVATPFDSLFAGVELQATVADNLLVQDFLRRPEHGVALEAQATLAIGMVIALLVGRAGLAWGGLGGLACLALLWGGAAWLVSATGAFLSPLFPTIGLLSSLVAITVAEFTIERQRADEAGEANAMSQELMVQSLLSLTEVRDGETGRHSRRTERYARLLAEQLSADPGFHDYLTPERIDLLARLAPLHDIGKVGVPDNVLNKPGALTSDEFAQMKKHPTYGRDVILQAERRAGSHDDAVLAMAKDIVYTHHERWDGTGYPQGLGGSQIPIPGRLVAIVDTYDALTSRRVYREGMSQDAAIALILEARGTHFDPAVVDAFYQVAPTLRTMSSEELV